MSGAGDLVCIEFRAVLIPVGVNYNSGKVYVDCLGSIPVQATRSCRGFYAFQGPPLEEANNVQCAYIAECLSHIGHSRTPVLSK